MAAAIEATQVGKREQLADLITCIEARTTPVSSMAKKEQKPNQILQEYQAMVFPTRPFTGVLDKKDADSFNSVGRVLLKARSMKMWDNPMVSDFAEQSIVAGVSGRGEMKLQEANSLVLVKRMVESRMLCNGPAQEDNGVVPNESQGLPTWIQSTSAGQLYPTPDDVLTPAASIVSGIALSAFTEETLVTALQSQYNARKAVADWTMPCGTKLKRAISKYSFHTDDPSTTSVRRINQDVGEKALIEVIDHLETDFGTIDLITSPWLYCDPATGLQTAFSQRSGLMLDMDYIALSYTRLPQIKPLPDLGGGPRSIVDVMMAILCYAPHAMGKVEISTD